MAGRAKENIPRGSLKYNFVYLKFRILYIYLHDFKHSYRTILYRRVFIITLYTYYISYYHIINHVFLCQPIFEVPLQRACGAFLEISDVDFLLDLVVVNPIINHSSTYSTSQTGIYPIWVWINTY